MQYLTVVLTRYLAQGGHFGKNMRVKYFLVNFVEALAHVIRMASKTGNCRSEILVLVVRVQPVEHLQTQPLPEVIATGSSYQI